MRNLLIVFVALTMWACAPESLSPELNPDAEIELRKPGKKKGKKDHGEDYCKIEDEQLGVVGATLDWDGITIVFTDWIPKDGESDEYIGFTFEASQPVSFVVKAGQDYFEVDAAGTTVTWVNPNGTGGPHVKAVSHVNFCDNEPDDTCPCPEIDCDCIF